MSHYETLGVQKDADLASIKKAFRRKASKAHTDRDGGDHAQMVAINRAYEVLSDPEKRDRYDRTGEDNLGLRPDQKAIEAVMQIVMQMVDQAQDWEDVIALSGRHIENTLREIDGKKKEANKLLSKLEKKRKRFTHKGQKIDRDFLGDLFAQRVGQVNQGIAQMDEGLAVFKRALELLEDYVYVPDKKPPSQTNQFNSGGSSFIWTTSS